MTCPTISDFPLMLIMVLSLKDRYNKGKEFQDYVRKLLSQAGYIEGQLYSTSGECEDDYYERLKMKEMEAYTSPDIVVLNGWGEDDNDLDKRYGLACSRRDSPFDRFGTSCVTFPHYQLKALREVQDRKGLPIYIVFGKKIVDTVYAVAVTDLKKSDEFMPLVDQSVGTKRWIDIFYLENLWSWGDFIQRRVDAGDHEPSPEKAKAVPRLM